MIRELLKGRLWIADKAGCTLKRVITDDEKVQCIVHACKTCHNGRIGKVPPSDPRYISFEEGGDLYLNMIDVAGFFHRQIFESALRMMRDAWLSNRPIRIHCDQGKSRAPMLALLFMAKVIGELPNDDLDTAWDEWEERFGKLNPSSGLEDWMRENWHSITAQHVFGKSGHQRKFEHYEPFNTDGIPDEEVIALIQGSPIVHFSSMVTIEHKDHERKTPVPNILQMRINEAYEYLRAKGMPIRLLVLKPRQVGCSTFCSHLCYHHARANHVDGMIIGDETSRVTKVWQMLCEYSQNDKFPWDSQFKFDTLKGKFTYSDGTDGQWEYDTANDPKAGISATRQVIHYTEAARFPKHGARTDMQVITASLASLADVPHSMAIAESTAEGACYDAKTELLTDQGWKFFKDLTGNEAILSKNQQTGVAYYEQFWQKQVHAYRGSMVKIDTRSLDLRVTANHQMWCSRQKGKMKMQAAKTLLGSTTDFHFDRAMKWEAEGVKEFRLPAYTHRKGRGWVTIPEKIIPIDVWLRFLGHWLSDGHVTFIPLNKCATLTQTKFVERFRRSAADLAKAIGFNFRDAPHGAGRRFTIESAQLASYLSNFSKPKRIPRDLLMRMTKEQCRLLMSAIYDGDGDQEKIHKSEDCIQGKVYCGIDKEFQDDVQELALKCGYATCAHGPARNRIATFTESIKACVRHNNPPKEEKDCEEDVYCVTLPRDHLLMVRRNGTAVWCGNSGWMYENWQEAATLDEIRAGKFGNGWVKIFAAWFEFSEHVLERTPQDEKYFVTDYDNREKRGIMLYGWDIGQIAWRRKTIATKCAADPSKFDQDFPEDDQRCWLQSGRPRFDEDGVSRLEILAEREHGLAERGILVGSSDNVTFQLATDDPWIWMKERPRPGCAYITSIDPCMGAQSKGARNPDAHACGVVRAPYLDRENTFHPAELVATIDVPLGCRWDDSLIALRCVMLSKLYGGTMIVPETGNGLGVLVKLREFGGNIYHRPKPDSIDPRKTLNVLGWETTSATRDIWVGAVADAISGQETAFNCCYLPAVKEMRTFVIDDRGKAQAQGGKHDDWITMLGLALCNMQFASVYRPYVRQIRDDAPRSASAFS